VKIRAFSIASLAAFLASATWAAAQDLSTHPPIRMGLWESEVTTNVSGAPDLPMGRGVDGGHTTVTQGCLTPESWTKEIQGAQQRHAADCTQSNLQQDPHKVTFDEVCSNQGGYSTNVHFEMLIDDPENGHGHAEVKTSGPAFPQGMTMHMTMKTKFLSSDCGSVKPGEGKVIHH